MSYWKEQKEKEKQQQKKIEIILPPAHSRLQNIIMTAFEQEAIEVWIACGTKFGKTLSCATAMCLTAPKYPNTLWRWVAPIYMQAQIGKKYIKQLLPGEPYVSDKQSGIDAGLYINPSKTHLQFFHGQYAESLEGEAVQGYVLDEAAKMKPEVYQSASTTTTFTRGKFLIPSTPLGKNWFYKKCMEAKEQMEADLAAGRSPKKIFLTAPTASNPYVNRESIIDARKRLPDRLFRQYFLAEFVDDGTVFTGFRNCLRGLVLQYDSPEARQRWIKRDGKQYEVTIGIDWAKHVDFTVFTAWAQNEQGIPEMVGFDRFQGMNYVSCLKEMIRFCMEFSKVNLVRHDKTGIGEVIDDLLVQTPYACDGIVFTNESKSHMVNSMMIGIQQGRMAVPHWDEMIKEVESYEVAVNPLGRMIYGAPQGMHDDIVSSMFLGYSAITESMGNFEVNAPLSQGGAESWYSDYIMSIAKDDDDFSGRISF